jgi:hypothetical protein
MKLGKTSRTKREEKKKRGKIKFKRSNIGMDVSV